MDILHVLQNSEQLDKKLLWFEQGHKIKNPKMQLVQRLQEIPVAVSLIISGTPIQNNLMEMHALFDFACEVMIHTMIITQLLLSVTSGSMNRIMAGSSLSD